MPTLPNYLGNVYVQTPIEVTQEQYDVFRAREQPSSDFFDQQYNVREIATALAPVALAIAASPFTAGGSILGYAASASLPGISESLDLPLDTLRGIKQGVGIASTLSGSIEGALMFEDWGFDSLTSFLGDSFDAASSFVEEIPFGQLAGSLLPVATSFLAPQGAQTGQVYPVLASGSQIIRGATTAVGAAATRGVVARSFFNKWPNLATAIQKLKNAGQNVTRAQLYSMLKRFGPDFLITAGILSAAAVSELMMAGAGRRRMNPGNVSALRRSMRRLESFHHLCQKSDKLRRPRARASKPCR